MYGLNINEFLRAQNKRLMDEIEKQRSIIEVMDSTIDMQAELIRQLEVKLVATRVWERRLDRI